MRRVVIIPRNGYVNRLQALVSAQILANEIDADLELAWSPQSAAPSNVDAVLNVATFPGRVATSEYRLPGQNRLDDVPVGVTRTKENLLLVAGGLRGEQVLMPELRSELKASTNTIVIVAGGKFWFRGDGVLSSSNAREFRNERWLAYQQLQLNTGIEEQARKRVAELPFEFVGLHLRYGDRNWQAPSGRLIRSTMRSLWRNSGRDVYVAGDDVKRIRSWSRWLQDHGWRVWTSSGDIPSMSSHRMPSALVDWRVLGSASQVLYFSESSFGEEAAVASGNYERSIPLQPSQTRAVGLRSLWHARNALVYPKRHWFSR